MLDVISIGDATVDKFLKIKDATVVCNINKEICQLCFNYADKIPIESISETIGGNACNTSVAFRRLKLKSALYAYVGADEVGEKIKKTLKQEKVSTKFLKLLRGQKSNQSTVLNFQGERTILIFHEPRPYKFTLRDNETRWFYLTSMAKGSEKIFPKFLEYVAKNRSIVFYNPGTFQLRLGIETSKGILQKTHVLFLNKEEAVSWTMLAINAPIKAHLLALSRHGPKIVIITDGLNGSYAYDSRDEKYYFCPIFPSTRVEATGAGDSYASGFAAAQCHGLDVPEGMRWGSFNAASVVEYIGPQAGLLTLDKILEKSKKFKDFKVEGI